MAYAAAISLSTQPLGQIIYGILFDIFSDAVYLVLVPAGLMLCLIGLFAKNFFKKTEEQLDQI
jgi:hypothetical protein